MVKKSEGLGSTGPTACSHVALSQVQSDSTSCPCIYAANAHLVCVGVVGCMPDARPVLQSMRRDTKLLVFSVQTDSTVRK